MGSCVIMRWRLELLAVSRNSVVVFTVLLHASREGDEVYWRRASVVLAASPHLPLYLLLPVAAACSAEGCTKHDGEAKSQDTKENPEGEKTGEKNMSTGMQHMKIECRNG